MIKSKTWYLKDFIFLSSRNIYVTRTVWHSYKQFQVKYTFQKFSYLKVAEEWILDNLLEQRMQHLQIDAIHSLIVTTTILHNSMIIKPFLHV